MKNRLFVLLTCLLCGTPNLFAQSVNLINEGSSTECTGLLYDTGGPDGDYGSGENFTYVICPEGGSSCIEFTLEYYNFENATFFDNLTIYDGDVNSGDAREITMLGGLSSGDGEVEGGVCFRTYATSGCLSVVFESDEAGTAAGFAAAWNCAPASCDDAAPIRVDDQVSVADLGEALRGAGTVISNISLNCASGQYGIFRGDGSDLGLETGVLLTTGRARAAIGPNRGGGAGGGQLRPFNGGDADLDALGALLGEAAESFDACVLELDVIVDTDELVFDYTFGSEEYPEFVDNEVNDIFAFFISGPGIDGVQELNGQKNIAVLDNGRNTVVQIDSINSNFNNEYYRNNELSQSVEYDGLTSGRRGSPKTLRARAAVTACETYHLKLAIADRGDEVFDSGVFIAGLSGGLPKIDVALSSGIDYLVEDCLDVTDSLRITFNNVKSTPQEFQLQTSGTAIRNQDYLLPGLPSTIVFQPGLNILTFPIVTIGDGIEEGEETIVFSFLTDFGCDVEVDVATVTLLLRDNIEVSLAGNNPEGPVFFCSGTNVELVAQGAGTYTWSTTAGSIIANGDSVTVTPTMDGQVTVIGALGTCTDTLTFDLTAVETTVEILNPDTVNICRGDTLLLEQTNNVSNQGIRWLTTAGFLDASTEPNPKVLPVLSRYYVVEAGPKGGCGARDSVYVDVDVFVVPELITDTLLCQGYPILLIQDSVLDVGNTTYNWSPGRFLEDSTDVNAVYHPENFVDTVFTLVSMAANGACTDTQSVRVELIPSELSIFGGDTLFRCINEGSVDLEVQVSPQTEARWFPTTGSTDTPLGSTFTVDPVTNVTYYAEAVVNGCYQIDSIYVRLDSLPEMTLTVDPEKDPFCQGDTFFITSPIYDPEDYPLIEHEWTVAPGLASPSELYNAVFFAADSALVTRVTTNGACMQTDTVQVNVIQPPILIFEPANPVVCPGEPLQINVSFGEGGPRGELEWEDPNNLLSCDDCLDPIATVNGPTTFSIEVTAEGSDCTAPSSYEIQIRSDLPPVLNPDRLLCSGDSRRVITGNIIGTYTYRIVGGGIDSDDPNVVVTPPADGTTYTVTTTGDCGTVTEDITFEFIDNYTLSVNGPGVICSGEEAVLTAQLSNGRQGTFTWTLPDGSTENGLQISVRPTITQNYSVTFADRFGCSMVTQTITVEVVGSSFQPIVTATNASGAVLVSGDTIFSGTQVTLMASGTPDGLDVSYEWSGNYDPSSGNEQDLTVTAPRENGSNLNYTVTVTTTEGGCEFTGNIVLVYVESRYEIPELITPNNDGTNDDFRIFYGGLVTDFNLMIFNRWGQRVYESTDIDEGWDGTKNGTPQNTDTYLYLAKFTINGLEVTEEGQFSLIR